MINLIAWLIVGGVMGWIANCIVNSDAKQDRLFNISVGIIGAALAGWLVSPVFVASAIDLNAFSPGASFISLIGAAIFLTVINLVGRDDIH